MKKIYFPFLSILLLISCEGLLNRPQMTQIVDSEYWQNEEDLRLYAMEYYPNYFAGYGEGWTTAYAALLDFTFSDDVASLGKQESFENSVPPSRGSNTLVPTSILQYSGPDWNFAWVRKSNIFIDRIENISKLHLTEEAYAHWMGVARFFRGFEYARLVSVFGDVPYYDKVFSEDDEIEMYKDRTPRDEVMGHVYDDFTYALENLRLDDGVQNLNRYIAAGFIARWMLFEGTWQKYHFGNVDLAKKYLSLVVKAAQLVMDSELYEISGDYRNLFGSQDLQGNKEVLLYRHYDASLNVTHSIATYSNAYAMPATNPNLSLAKSFICADGYPYQTSALPNAEMLDVKNMIKTRDSRFEATFWDEPSYISSTLLCATKFIDRVGPTYWDSGNIPPMYSSSTNTNDYPVMRYSEILLSWIEAKAELAALGEAPVTQADLDLSINAIRNRELAPEAIAKGVQKTAPMQLVNIDDDFDPARDQTVSPLIWEIRRERRMEFFYEHSRLLDLKRWKKLEYMDNNKYPDTMLGVWVDLREVPNRLVDGARVQKEDGTIVEYDGSNADEMVGFFVPENVVPRDMFTERSYLAPIGKAQIDDYESRGYVLTQTPLW